VDASPDLEAYLARLGTWTAEEQIEELLKVAAGVIATHDPKTLGKLRAHLLKTLPEGPPKQTLIEIIEGQMALIQRASHGPTHFSNFPSRSNRAHGLMGIPAING
jgi:hypothetical protein